MQFKYKNVKMLLKGGLVQTFKKIEGIGLSRAKNLLNLFGYPETFKINGVSIYDFGEFVQVFKGMFILDERLQEITTQRIEFFYIRGFEKGKRLILGLPLKGRTHSNGSSAYMCRPNIPKFFDEINAKKQNMIVSKKKKQKK